MKKTWKYQEETTKEKAASSDDGVATVYSFLS